MKLYLEANNIPDQNKVNQLLDLLNQFGQAFEVNKESLSMQERQGTRKMGPRRLAYAEMAAQKGLQHESIMPRNFDPQDFKTWMTYYNNLRNLRGKITEILEAVDDTMMAVGIDAMSYTKVVHDILRSMNTMDPSLDESLKDLDEFNKQASREVEELDEETTEE